MIRTATAIRYDRLATSGRNMPLLVSVETEDGVEHDAFLKPSARPELGCEGLLNEALAACLAADLGLPVCEPFLVQLNTDWCASIPDAAVRQCLMSSSPTAFASKAAGPGWRLWNGADTLSATALATALGVAAFDAFIGNDDRRAENSNLLVKGNDFRLIDHESTFRLRLKLFPPVRPWEMGNLRGLAEGHVLARQLQGRSGLDFGSVRDRWADLPDARLSDYVARLPRDWLANDLGTAALTHLAQVRDRVDDCMAELERALK